MKATVWLIIAAVCLVLGIVLCGAAWAKTGFDFNALNTEKSTQNTHVIEQSFKKVEIKTESRDIVIRPAIDGKCTVETYDSEQVYYDVSVQDGTLKIIRKDTRKWYERIGIFWWEGAAISVYLPQEEYESFRADVASGDISVSGDISIGKVTLNTASGDIVIDGSKAQSITAGTASGEIKIRNVTVSEAVGLEVASGDIELSQCNVGSLRMYSASGDIELSDVVARDLIHAETASGDVEFARCDAHSLALHTASGDIKGSLLTGKAFDVRSTSGKERVPQDTLGAGTCLARAASGDIIITVK